MPESAYVDIGHDSWGLEHRYGDNVRILAEPFLLTHLARLCAPETAQPEINDLVELCYGRLLAAVVDREFPRAVTQSDTRMAAFTERGRYVGTVIDSATRTVTVDVARAGTLPSHVCFHMLCQLLDPAMVRQDHVSMERDVDEQGSVVGASIQGSKIGGDVDGAIVLFPDPMGATGSSMIEAINHYQSATVGGVPKKIITMHVIVTPEYIRALGEACPHVKVYAIRLDRGMSDDEVLSTVLGTHADRESGLNEQQYIVPGGGGFGEILNNTEK